MLTGLETITDGTVTVMGMSSPDQWSEIRQMIGLCPQRSILYPDLTAREHLIFYGNLKGLEGEALDRNVEE